MCDAHAAGSSVIQLLRSSRSQARCAFQTPWHSRLAGGKGVGCEGGLFLGYSASLKTCELLQGSDRKCSSIGPSASTLGGGFAAGASVDSSARSATLPAPTESAATSLGIRDSSFSLSRGFRVGSRVQKVLVSVCLYLLVSGWVEGRVKDEGW